MKATNFCYWLQGYFEIATDSNGLSEQQVQVIKNHLNLAFAHDIDIDNQSDGGDVEK